MVNRLVSVNDSFQFPGVVQTAQNAIIDARAAIVAAAGSVPLGSLASLDPAGKTNGAIGAFDTGQTASPASFGNAPLTYIGGKIAHVPFAGVNSAGYLQVALPTRVRRFGAMVAWPVGALGAAVFVLPSPAWGTVGNIVGTPAGIHLVMYGNGIWVMSRWNAPGLTAYASDATHGRYADVRDGVARAIDIWVEPEAGTARIYFPDSSSAVVAHAAITNDTSSTAVWELYENNGVTDTPATIGKVWADNTRIAVDAVASGKPAVTDAILAAQRTVTEHLVTGGGTIPPGCKGVLVTLIAGGGGGGSGRRGAAGTVRAGGSAGGTGGVIQDTFIPAAALTSTAYTVTVPAAATGGAAVAANDTNGNPGGTGGTVDFTCGAAYLRALGGGGGGGGTTTSGTAGNGGAPLGLAGVVGSATGSVGNGGGNSFAGGCGQSGAGGGVTSADVASNGGVGTAAGLWSSGAGGAAGVVGGAVPGLGAALLAGRPGDGAGGGAGSIVAAAQAGGVALGYGAGGAGGGGSLNGFNSGAGGNGGPGYVRVTLVRS